MEIKGLIKRKKRTNNYHIRVKGFCNIQEMEKRRSEGVDFWLDHTGNGLRSRSLRTSVAAEDSEC